MNLHLRFVKHILLVGFIEFLGIAQTMIFLPIITKILGAEDYGIWSQIKVTVSLLAPFTYLGLHEALKRFLPGEKNKEKLQEGIYSSLILVFVINLLVSILLILFSGYLVPVLKFNATFVNFLALIIIFESLNTILLVAVRAIREMKKYFWFMVLKMTGELILVVAVVLLGYGLYGAVSAFLAIRIIVFIALVIFALLKFGFKIPNFSLSKAYLSFGLPTIADGASYWVMTSVDRYFIAFFWGMIFVGYYSPAYSLGTMLTFFLFPVAFMLSVVLPKFFDENNIDEVKKYLSHSLKYFLSLAIPGAFGVSVLASPLLAILSTNEIAEKSYLVVPLVAASIVFYGISYFYGEVLVLVKKTKVIAFVWAIGAILNIILNIVFIKSFGIVAAGATTLASYFLALILMNYLSKKEFSFAFDFTFCFKSILASILMSLTIFILNPKGLVMVSLSIIFGAIIYFVLMFIFKGFGKSEKIFLKDLFYEMAFFVK